MLPENASFAHNMNPDHYGKLSPKLHEVVSFVAGLLARLGLRIQVTSMVRPRALSADSGVHASGRAIDFIIKKPAGASQHGQREAGIICAVTNLLFRRSDQRFTLLWHDHGTGWHYHVQVQAHRGYVDLQGSVPEKEVFEVVHAIG